jgi:hypothetical protein
LLVLSLLVVVLVVVSFLRPAVGKFVGKMVAVVTMGLGVGLLVWGILAAARGDSPPPGGPFAGASYSLVIGSGAGFLTAGIVALVLACAMRVARADVPSRTEENGAAPLAGRPRAITAAPPVKVE